MAPTVFKIAYLFLALAALPQVLARPQASPPTDPPATDAIRDEALNGHNSFRALHGASPLNWNVDLAAAAGSWVSRCAFQHGGGQGVYGENLAAGPGGFSVTDGINSWTAEAAGYTPEDFVDHLHFTQVVWKGTTDVGCAIVNCPAGTISPDSDYRFLACEYSPAGNVIGQFEQNVQA